MKIGERLYVTCGIASKAWQPGISYFGRAWFYWRPHFSWNKALPFSQKVFDFGFSWLYFFWGVSLWPKWVKEINHGQCGRQIGQAFAPKKDGQ